jgi:hypothetical protein
VPEAPGLLAKCDPCTSQLLVPQSLNYKQKIAWAVCVSSRLSRGLRKVRPFGTSALPHGRFTLPTI